MCRCVAPAVFVFWANVTWIFPCGTDPVNIPNKASQKDAQFSRFNVSAGNCFLEMTDKNCHPDEFNQYLSRVLCMLDCNPLFENYRHRPTYRLECDFSQTVWKFKQPIFKQKIIYQIRLPLWEFNLWNRLHHRYRFYILILRSTPRSIFNFLLTIFQRQNFPISENLYCMLTARILIFVIA